MKRISIILTLLLSIILGTFANPASLRPVYVVQNDGSELELFLKGDEWFHYYATEDNVPLIQGEDSSYYYLTVNDGQLINSGLLAHNSKDRSADENDFVTNIIDDVVAAINERYDCINIEKQNSYRRRISARSGRQIDTLHDLYAGKKKGLVILVNFADVEMSGENPNLQFNRLFNERGYSDNNHIGSVHDYFYDQSYGQFDLEFDVVGPVTVSRELAYYGKNDPITNSDKYPRQMVAEACRLADPYVNFSDYDWDGDGEVDQVFVIYAGYGESNGASSNTIWPHESILYGIEDNNFCLDGVRIYTYACSCELAGYRGTTITGIGTPCHEFSHCLGLPDFYDVNYNGGFGMSYWDVMCNGSHSGPEMNGEIPSGFTAYERWFAGWLEFDELAEMERIKDMPPLQEQPVAYKIINDNYPDEYFILENRQNNRWFSYLGEAEANSGLLVYHVDYSPTAWTTNSVNTNRAHQRMSIVPADNNYGTYIDNGSSKGFMVSADDLSGDLFPGSKNVTEFTNSSHSNVGGKLFNPNSEGGYYINKPLTNIKNIDGNVSFDFMGGIFVPTPVVKEVYDISDKGFKVSWLTDSPVDSYSIEVVEVKKKSTFETKIIEETFDDFITTQTDQDGKMDLSIYIDSYMNSKGWKSENVFTSKIGMKIGNDDAVGTIESPDFDLSSGNLTILFSSMCPDDNAVPLELILMDDMDQECRRFVVPGLPVMTENLFNVEGIETGIYRLKIISKTPFYVNKLVTYDESYSEDEIKSGGGLASILKPVEKIIDSDIADDYYVLDNLKGTKYKFRIRACLDEAFSEWTDYIVVDLMNSNSVESIFNGVNDEVRIYDLSGKSVSRPLAPGIYIIKSGDKVTKVRI